MAAAVCLPEAGGFFKVGGCAAGNLPATPFKQQPEKYQGILGSQQRPGGALPKARAHMTHPKPKRRGCTRCLTCSLLSRCQQSFSSSESSGGGAGDEFDCWWPAGIQTPTVYFQLRRRQLDACMRQQAQRPAAVWRAPAAAVATGPSALRAKRGLGQLRLQVPASCTNVAQNDTTVRYQGSLQVPLCKAQPRSGDVPPAPGAALPASAPLQPSRKPSATPPAPPVPFSPRSLEPVRQPHQQGHQLQQEQHLTPASREHPAISAGALRPPGFASQTQQQQTQQPQQGLLQRSLSVSRRRGLSAPPLDRRATPCHPASDPQAAREPSPPTSGDPKRSRLTLGARGSASQPSFPCAPAECQPRQQQERLTSQRNGSETAPATSATPLWGHADGALPPAGACAPSAPAGASFRTAAAPQYSAMRVDSFSTPTAPAAPAPGADFPSFSSTAPSSARGDGTGSSCSSSSISSRAGSFSSGVVKPDSASAAAGCPPGPCVISIHQTSAHAAYPPALPRLDRSYLRRQLQIKSEQAFACHEVVHLTSQGEVAGAGEEGGAGLSGWGGLIRLISRKISPGRRD